MKYKDPELERLNRFTHKLFGYDRWVVKYVNHEFTLYSMRNVARRKNDDAKINLRKSCNSCMDSTKCYSFGGDVRPVIDKWTELLEIEKRKIKKQPDYYNKKPDYKILRDVMV